MTSSTPSSASGPNNLNERLDAYNETIQKIVEEERRTGSKMPAHKGLERYKLIEKMGDGAFSIVYKAFDTETATNVAVKVIHKQNLEASQVSRTTPNYFSMRKANYRSNIEII